VEHARASGASERSAHAAKKVGHGTASGGRGSSAALRSGSAPAVAAFLLRQLFGRAAKFATARRSKSRSGRRRKSTALLVLSGRVSLGSGRDADGRWLKGQFASACRRVVAQARGLPHRSGEPKKSADAGLLAARSRQPRCEGVWPRLRAGFCCKAARACSQIRHGPARQATFIVAKKLMAGPRFSGCGLSSAGGQTSAWRLRAGVVFYFRRLTKKFTTSWRFLPRRLVHNQIFTPFFRPVLGLRPCSGLTSALSGTG